MSQDLGAAPSVKPEPKLTKALPSSRMSFSKQLDLIRAYGVLGGSGEPTKLADAADMVKVHPSNVSTMNPFMLENGLVSRTASGLYTPDAALVEFGRAHAWNPDTAPQKLAPLFRNSWFGQTLTRRAAFGQFSEEKAIEALALECSAGPEFRAQIRMLIDYAEVSGLIRRDNGQILAGSPSAAPSQPLPPQKPQDNPAPPATTEASAGFIGTDGAVSLNVSIHVNLAELKGWPADRITAFFAGIAQVVAAREKASQ